MHKTIGLISDTHALLREEAVEALKGSDIIIHAGDIGKEGIIESLAEICPVFAIRGNVDKGAWAQKYPETEVVEFGDIILYVLHDINELDLDPAAAGFQVVVSGHSHKPEEHYKEGVLYINPGSAGKRRFSLPISLAKLHLKESRIEIEWVDLS